MRRLGRGDDLLFARSCLPPVGDVRGNGIIEQGHILADQPDVGTQAGEANALDVVAVDVDFSGASVEEPRHQIGQGGLPAAGLADQCDGFRSDFRLRF
jgi:hypothetical protein